VLPAFCICLVLFAAAAAWPQVRHSGTGSGNEPIVTTAAVQGNVPRLGLEFNAQRLAVLGNDVRETRRLADDVRAGRAPQPDFVVWPEDASEIDPLTNPDAAQQISMAVEAIGAPILVGTVLDVADRTSDAPAETKHGDRLESEGRTRRPPRQADRAAIRGIPALARLLPASVRARQLGRLYRPRQRHRGPASRGYSDWDRDLLGGNFSTARCETRSATAPSCSRCPPNNANFNQMMSEQQLAFSKVRAVELDRYDRRRQQRGDHPP